MNLMQVGFGVSVTKILSCDLHDYLEIACMYAYQVELELNEGQKCTGKPLTTITSEQKEYLLFRSDTAPDKELKLGVLEIKSMRVLSKNARFKFVEFK